METKVTKIDECHLDLDVVLDHDVWVDAQKKAFDKLAKDVTIDGFRKGKAPENLVRDKISQSKLMDEAINSIIQQTYMDALQKEDVHPYASPEASITKISDSELELKFRVTTEPKVELGPYKGLAIGKEEPTVSDAEVEAEIAKVQLDNSTLVLKEGKAENGDVVVIDAVGVMGDPEEPFEGGDVKNYELELGSGSFVPGFEEQLIGVGPEEDIDVHVTFPENYVENLAGKPATFHVHTHEVKTKQLPELSDALVQSLQIEGVKTIEQLRASKRAELLRKKTQQARSDYIGKVLANISEHSKLDIPHEIIDSEVNAMKEDAENQMAQSGLDLATYLSIIGQTEEQFMEGLHETAHKNVNNYFILDAVGKAENIVIDDSELEFEYAKMAETYHMEIEQVKEALAPQLNQFRDSVRFNRIEDILYRENN